jgi:hypothetical protein
MKIVSLLLVALFMNAVFAAAPNAAHPKKRVAATHNKAASHKAAGKKTGKTKGKAKKSPKIKGSASKLNRGQAHAKANSHKQKGRRSPHGGGANAHHAASGGMHGMPAIKNIQQIDQCLAGDVRDQFRSQIEEFAKFKDLPQMFKLIQKQFIPVLVKLDGFSQKLNKQGLVAENAKDISVIQKKCQAISAKRKIPVNVCVQKMMHSSKGSKTSGKSFNAKAMQEALLKPLMQLNAVQKNKKPISFLEFESALNNFLEEIDYYIVKGIVYQQAFRKVKNANVQKVIDLGDKVFAQLGKMVNNLHEITNILQNDVVYTHAIACHPAQYFASLGGINAGGNMHDNSFNMNADDHQNGGHEMLEDDSDQPSIWDNHDNMHNQGGGFGQQQFQQPMNNNNGFAPQNQWQSHNQQFSNNQQPNYGQSPSYNGQPNYNNGWGSSNSMQNPNYQGGGYDGYSSNSPYQNVSMSAFNSMQAPNYQGGGYNSYSSNAPYQNSSVGSWGGSNALQPNSYGGAYDAIRQQFPNYMPNNSMSSYSGNGGYGQSIGGFTPNLPQQMFQPSMTNYYAQPQTVMPQMQFMPTYTSAAPNTYVTGVSANTVSQQPVEGSVQVADDGYETVMMPVQVNSNAVVDGQALQQQGVGQANSNSGVVSGDNSVPQQQVLTNAMKSVERELQDTEDKIEASASKLENAVVRAEKAANRAEKAADKVVVGASDNVDGKKKSLTRPTNHQKTNHATTSRHHRARQG